MAMHAHVVTWKNYKYKKVILLSLVTILAFVAANALLTNSAYAASSGYYTMPNRIPEPDPAGNPIYITLSTTRNDRNGNGAFQPDTDFKIYSDVKPTSANYRAKIQIDPSGSDEACDGMFVVPQMWRLNDYEGNLGGDNGIDWTGGPVPTRNDCSNFDLDFNPDLFVYSKVPGHGGLWVAKVRISLSPNNKVLNLHAAARGGSKMGLAQGGKVNLHAANHRQRDENQYDVRFRPECNYFDKGGSAEKTLSWSDDDYGTYLGGPDVPGAGPENTRLSVYVGAIYDRGGSTLAQVSNLTYSGRGGQGRLDLNNLEPGASYGLSFQFVDDGNTIQITWPFDSGDYYIKCESSPPVISAVAPSCEPHGKAVNGIAYDPDSLSKNIQVEIFLGGPRGTGSSIGRVSTVGPGYYSMNVDAAMGSPPSGTFTFYAYALGVDSSGATDGQDSTPAIVTVRCGGLPGAVGCPSMPEGIKPVTVPDRDGIPPSDPVPANGKVYQEQANAIMFTREPVNPANGQVSDTWYHKMLQVYDQWGETDGGYLPLDWTNNPTFAIDYTPFMRAYPYDYHAVSLLYSTAYKETMYVYNIPSGEYYCDNGGVLQVDHKCYTSYTANTVNPDFPACPFGGEKAGSMCIVKTPAKQYYKANKVAVDKQMWWAYGPAAPPAPDHWTNAYTPVLNPCYNRTYEVKDSDVSASQPQIVPNNENPTNVTFQYQFGVTYGLVPPQAGWQPYDRPQSPPVRSPFTANVNYQANYYLNRGGAMMPLYSKTSASGTDQMPTSMYTGGPQNVSKVDSPGISVPPLRAGDQICMTLDVYYRNGEMKNDGNDPVFGNRPITEQVDGTDHVTVDSACSAPVTNEPYAHFFGGDVQAGPGFSEGETCQVDPNGQIRTLTRTTGPLPKGSGSQFAAQALGDIQGLSTATLRRIIPTSSTGLSFSNTENTGGGTFDAPNTGGKFGLGGSYCIPDYFGTKPKETTVNTTATTAPIGTAGAQWYRPAGGKVTIDGGTVAAGTQQAIFIENADVYIRGNIQFGGATTGWNSLKDIPSLYIIVKNGNVRIDPSVTQLDGIYIAQPNSGTAKGVISTCGTADRSFAAYEIFNTCKNQLVVNGAFVARQVFLNRSFGSLRYAERYAGTSGESPLYGSAHACGEAGSDVPVGGPLVSNDCAAEIFNFSPEFYLAQPATTPSSGPASGKFDSITSLSPVL